MKFSLPARARKNTLNKIIESEGDCFSKGLCSLCPLFKQCIRPHNGIMKISLTKEQRVTEACQLLLDIEINPDTLELLE